MNKSISLKNNNFFIVLISALFIFESCKDERKTGPGGPIGPIPYKIATVYTGPATMYFNFPATIQGEQDIEIRPKVDGFIEKIFVDEGVTVHKGQPLFKLKNLQYEAAVRNAGAAVKIAEADVNTAEMNLEKVRPLVEKNIISNYELKSDEFTLQSKKASLASAKADLLNAEVNVSYTFLTSPTDGVISNIPYKVGTLITSASTNPLTTVYNTKNIFVYFSLNEKQMLGFLKAVKGKTLKDKLASREDVSLVLADGSEYPVRGRIVTASGLVSTETGSITFRANFSNPNGLIRSGNSATIKIPIKLDTALLIPQNATYDLQGKKFVFTLNKMDSVVNTPVRLSENTIGDLFIVQSGLKSDERIIIEGISTLKPGMVVKPVRANADSVYAQAKDHSVNLIKKLIRQ